MLVGILLAIHILVCVALIGVILIQRSEGGALGMGGGGQGAFLTVRGAGDLITRITSILAALFFILSLTLTLLAGHERAQSSVLNQLDAAGSKPAPRPLSPVLPVAPTAPAAALPLQAPRPDVGSALAPTFPAAPAAPVSALSPAQSAKDSKAR